MAPYGSKSGYVQAALLAAHVTTTLGLHAWANGSRHTVSVAPVVPHVFVAGSHFRHPLA